MYTKHQTPIFQRNSRHRSKTCIRGWFPPAGQASRRMFHLRRDLEALWPMLWSMARPGMSQTCRPEVLLSKVRLKRSPGKPRTPSYTACRALSDLRRNCTQRCLYTRQHHRKCHQHPHPYRCHHIPHMHRPGCRCNRNRLTVCLGKNRHQSWPPNRNCMPWRPCNRARRHR